MTKRPVEVGSFGFRFGGSEHRILSGEVHSWRLEPERWGAILDLLVDNGFNTVSAYVPWSEHEQERGRFDFSGPRDVARFLQLAAERGLWAIVRPGPDAASEIPDSGWPRRVLDDERSQALRSNGVPYVLPTATSHVFAPSYASRFFLDEVALWYDAVFEVLEPLQYPDGPIIACQVDNEIGYHFQPHSFALDYHPESVAGFRKFVEARHGSIEHVEKLYGVSFGSFDEVQAPAGTDEESEVAKLDWIEWREQYLREALAALAEMQRARGMDRVPLIHNDYPRMATPLDPSALESEGAIDVAAGDIYTGKEGGFWLKEFVRYVAGTSKLPFMLELGAGWLTLPWLFPARVSPQDQEVVTMRAFLGGIKAANVYMLVERDRWYASPIAADGSTRPERLGLYRRLAEFLDRSGILQMNRWAPVLVLENRTESRRAAAREILGEHSPPVPHLFPVDRRLFEQPHPDTDELREWERGLASVLNDAGVDFDRAVSSSLPDIEPYEIVVMPCLDAMDPTSWQSLAEVASSGKKVIVGPRTPSIDHSLQPFEFVSDGFIVLDSPEELGAHLPTPPFSRSSKDLDLYLWQGVGREILGAANSSSNDLQVEIAFNGQAKLEGLWRDENLAGNGSIEVSLKPWEIQVWEVFK